MSERLKEQYVEELLEHGCQIVKGRITVTPVRRHKNANMEFMVDCDHFKHTCSELHKTVQSAALKFCMLKNVIYEGTNVNPY
jgi:methionyl-tRNA synthetase